jgi:hypothetical protein
VQGVVEPVEDLLVESRPVPSLAVPIRALGGGEADQRLGAAKRLIKALSPGPDCIALGPRHQSRAADTARHVGEAVAAHVNDILTQGLQAMDPQSSLDEPPAKQRVSCEASKVDPVPPDRRRKAGP